MSVFAGLTAKVKLAGIVALSSWLLLSSSFREQLPKPQLNEDTPILLCHGDADPLVRPELNRLSYQTLNALGYNITRKEYPYAIALFLFSLRRQVGS